MHKVSAVEKGPKVRRQHKAGRLKSELLRTEIKLEKPDVEREYINIFTLNIYLFSGALHVLLKIFMLVISFQAHGIILTKSVTRAAGGASPLPQLLCKAVLVPCRMSV